jgi:hypothetical protein
VAVVDGLEGRLRPGADELHQPLVGGQAEHPRGDPRVNRDPAGRQLAHVVEHGSSMYPKYPLERRTPAIG